MAGFVSPWYGSSGTFLDGRGLIRRQKVRAAVQCSVSEPFLYTTPRTQARRPVRKAGSRPDALLTLGLPKGSLQDATLDLFHRAGWAVKVPSRSYFPILDDEEVNAILLRAQELGRYTASGIVDCAITGFDWICENEVEDEVVEVGELNYSKVSDGSVRWVLAVPQDSDVNRPEDLEGALVSTELMGITKKYFENRSIRDVRLEFSWGATEVKARGSFVDAIVDVTETGESLRANNLRVLDVVLRSSTRLIANREAWKDPLKRKKIEDMYLLLDGALKGKRKVGLKFNVSRDALPKVLEVLPSTTSPTIAPLADDKFVALEVVVDDRTERLFVPQLKALGCVAIFTYPLSIMID
mmetsp:Transcript_16897/g.35064  ORF Transcript_16897/g.35064 Transcript_16897/m.35064 type:complete len:354 (-) Transcript_16897:1642-2703(-)|eukprot:CAMPEP_0184679378 /NCGR_PEP_ID=MMETSP0312-20130426/2214_1 /TAXON_ID=31354 /ORGANISM="Compsopogon coeruleus, Strain SAG 36.94" /LENGTH=353 /DNA_ID=CAMNT_0027128781 /DNA_START=1556 /DNA_END=2617 /DNA_ORIENTATION=+